MFSEIHGEHLWCSYPEDEVALLDQIKVPHKFSILLLTLAKSGWKTNAVGGAMQWVSGVPSNLYPHSDTVYAIFSIFFLTQMISSSETHQALPWNNTNFQRSLP